jgi:hypothetical protein
MPPNDVLLGSRLPVRLFRRVGPRRLVPLNAFTRIDMYHDFDPRLPHLLVYWIGHNGPFPEKCRVEREAGVRGGWILRLHDGVEWVMRPTLEGRR